MKKNGGFTLVELIIVIAILAILSTGAIAGYSRYIENANNTAVNAWLSDISTSAVLANAEHGAVAGITVLVKDANNVTITVNGVGENFKELFEASVKGLSNAKYDAKTGTYTADVAEHKSWDSSEFTKTANSKNYVGATWTNGTWSKHENAAA
jgi:prepilin-type N-terminal cleavage/methylation domain-containing protein